jgi:hypothetical protein
MTHFGHRTDVMQQLHTLNRDYVEHVIHTESENRSHTFSESLGLLSLRQRHDLGAAPYSLFYLPFDKPDYWQRAMMPVTSGFASPGTQRGSLLVASSLMLAWHLSRTDPGAARLCFGMSARTVDLFRGAGVGAVLASVESATESLRPRWPAHAHFWPELIAAVGNDAVRMHAARLLGSQLLALEITADDQRAYQPPRASVTGRARRGLKTEQGLHPS